MERRSPVARYDAKMDASAAAEVALLKGVRLTRESPGGRVRRRDRAVSPWGSRQRAVGLVYGFAASEAEDRIEAWCATLILEPMIQRTGFEIAEAKHSQDGIFAKYLLRAV